MNKIKHIYYKFYIGIKNLIVYFPIIWNDRNFDYYFIYKLLHHKLKLTRNSIKKVNIHTSSKRDAEILNTIIKLIELQDSDYYDKEFRKYYIEKLKVDKNNEIDFELINDNSEEYFKKHKLAYKKIKNKYPNVSNKKLCIYLLIDRENKCKNLIWDLLKHNINKFWY